MSDQKFKVDCGFFDAVNNDRLYSADQMNLPYKRIISNGIFAAPDGSPSEDFAVVVNSGMHITVKAGDGLFGGKWFISKNPLDIIVPANSGGSSRVDSVIIQVDNSTAGRAGNIVYRTGGASAPSINTDSDILEYRVANLTIPPYVSAVTAGMITDLRGGTSCPWIRSLVYQPDNAARIDEFISTYGVSNGTKIEETVLFTSSTPVQDSTAAGDGGVEIASDITSFDYVDIRYAAFGRTGIVRFKGSDIRTFDGDNDTGSHWSEFNRIGSRTDDATPLEKVDFLLEKIDATHIWWLSEGWAWSGKADETGKAVTLTAATGKPLGIYSITGVNYVAAGTVKDPELTDIRVGASAETYPTAGDAVRDQVESLQKNVGGVTGVTLIDGFQQGKYIQTNLNVGETVLVSSPQNSANFSYKIIAVSEGDAITLNGTGGNAGRLWAFVDSSNALISNAAVNVTASNLVLTAPANSAKLVLNMTTASIGANYVGTSVDSRIAGNVDATLSVSGNAADAKVVGDEISQIKNDVYESFADANIWESGGISYTNGDNASTSARLRTKEYISEDVVSVSVADVNHKIGVYIYTDTGTYIGVLQANGTIAQATAWIGSADFSKLRIAHPNYKFRVVASNQNDSAITLESYTYFLLTMVKYVTDDNISDFYRVITAENDNTLWVDGGISYSDGSDVATAIRIRTGFIDNAIAKIYSTFYNKFGSKLAVFAWDNKGVYVGRYSVSLEDFEKSGLSDFWLGVVDLQSLRKRFPNYRFKVVASFNNDANITWDILGIIKIVRFECLNNDAYLKKSTNLFDYYTATFGQINTTTGAVESSTGNKISAIIPIKPSTKYTYNQTYTRIAFYTSAHVFISSSYSDDGSSYTVTSPATAAYCRIISNAGKMPLLQLNEGDTLLPYEPYFREIIRRENIEKDVKSYAFSAMPIPTTHESVTCEAIDGSGQYDDDTLSVSQVYGWYDALAEAYPDYIAKHDWGMDASNTYHIYSYSFIPESLEDNNNLFSNVKTYPKMLLRGGCHGNGTSGDHTNMIHALYFLLYDVCHNYAGNAFLTYLRYNVQLEILPLMNPWGVQNKSRKNSNSVDINRNFSYGWALGSSSAADYGGTAPFTEAESIAIRDFVNFNLDAFCDIEFHAVSREYQTQPHMMYFDTVVDSEMYYVNRGVIVELTQKWKQENYAGLTDINYYGYIDGTSGAGQVTSWVTHEANIPSTIIEGFPNYENSGYTTNGIEIMEMCLDEVNCIILSAIRYFGQIKK